jgi:hypothetical protein
MSYQLGKDGFVYTGTSGVAPSGNTLCATEWTYSASEEGGDTLDVTTFCSSAAETVETAGSVSEEISYTILECTSTRVLDENSISVGINSTACYTFLEAKCISVDTTAPIDDTVETTVVYKKK